MKLTIDTESDSLEDLQNALSIISKSIQKKNGVTNQVSQQNIQQVQQEPIKKPNIDNPYIKRLVEQEKLMKNIDDSFTNILQSDFGLQKRRQEALHK